MLWLTASSNRNSPRGMKLYHGIQSEHGPAVVVEEDGECRALDPRYDLCRLSANGFGWGYAPGGPDQLALALACDVLGDEMQALAVSKRLKVKLVALLPDEGWVLSADRVRAAVDAIWQETGQARRR